MPQNDFIELSPLGTGSFGTVSKVLRLSDNAVYALKKIKYLSLSARSRSNALTEIRVLASIEHDNVVGYKEAFFWEDDGVLGIVMELAQGGDLSSKIKSHIQSNHNFYQYQIWSMGYDILKGLQALHCRKILHRDLKPANVFFGKRKEGGRGRESGKGEFVAKLGDFNVAKILGRGLAETQTGTPYYASPEVWANQEYGFQCDIWSFGCILYQLCTLRKPFEAETTEKLYKKIISCKYKPISFTYTPELRDIIGACLRERARRIKLEDLLMVFGRCCAPREELGEGLGDGLDLLETIRVPMNRKDFEFCLPKPKYSRKPKKRVVTSIQPTMPPQHRSHIPHYPRTPKPTLIPIKPPSSPSILSPSPSPSPSSILLSPDPSSQRILMPSSSQCSIGLPSSRSIAMQGEKEKGKEGNCSFKEVISLGRVEVNREGLEALKGRRRMKGIVVVSHSKI